MANTYEAIATNTLGSAAASVTFSSIPSTYTDLILVMSPSVASLVELKMRFNSDTGSNYSSTELTGTGTTAGSSRHSNQTSMYVNYNAYAGNDFNSNFIAQIQNYSNSTTYKTALIRANNAGYGVDAIVGLWRSTAAITSITILNGASANFQSGSTFSLYGITAA